jgi:two-component system sensor histidine kinase UhpB
MSNAVREPNDVEPKTGVPRPAPPSALSWLGKKWNKFPFRWQILIAISIVTLLTSMLGGVFAVLDSHRRAGVETQSNIELWAGHIEAKVRMLERPEQLLEFAAHLDAGMANVRHVSVTIRDRSGKVVGTFPNPHGRESDTEDRAPSWFTALVQPEVESRNIEIAPHGELTGSVEIRGVPDDEIAETWDLLKLMALLWLGAIAVMMVGLYFILGLILNPLAKLGSGMQELEGGHYGFRLDMPHVRELESIAAALNKLAAALDSANAENSNLYRQLIAVQEEERREISRDLHDEFGPCLFGIMAATTSVAHHAKTLPPAQASPILACVDEIVQVSGHLKSMNRALLNRLRPIALGRQTIKELLSELVDTFRRRHRGVLFDCKGEDLPATLGEEIDLTIYRCVQEGVTNAVRHGRPHAIKVEVSLSNLGEKRAATVTVTDDGAGMKQAPSFGYGLSSMRERVQELDGSLKFSHHTPHGTVLTILIPLPEVIDAKRAEASERSS